MSDAPKGGKQAPKVAKKGEKRAGKKGGKIVGSSEKKRKRRRKESYGQPFHHGKSKLLSDFCYREN